MTSQQANAYLGRWPSLFEEIQSPNNQEMCEKSERTETPTNIPGSGGEESDGQCICWSGVNNTLLGIDVTSMIESLNRT